MSEQVNQSWSIIVLCYNEEGNIKRVVRDVQDKLAIISTKEGEVILVNDGSSDNSDTVIKKMIQEKGYTNIKYICHETNKGIGEALRTGYSKASCNNVVMVPGDGQFDLEEFVPYKNVPESSILTFYRAENTTYTVSRNIFSWVNNVLNRIFIGLNLKDVNWVKVYKNKALQELNLELRSSLVESEICCKLIYLGHQPIEVKSKYLPRQAGQSKGTSFNIVKQAVLDIIRLIWVIRRFKRKIKKQ